MKNRNNIEARVDDWIYQSLRYNRPVASWFLTLEEIQEVKKYIYNRVNYIVDGGYNNALRQEVIFNYEDGFSNIVCLKSLVNTKFCKIEHRDVLGALMGLNIERKLIGDIIVKNDFVAIYCNESISKYIIDNLLQISKISCKFNYSDKIENEVQFKEILINVSSLRIDAVVSSVACVSRSEACNMIKAHKVYLNNEILEENSVLCHNGDTISIRKVGRFIIKEIVNKTRKDRLVVKVLQYV